MANFLLALQHASARAQLGPHLKQVTTSTPSEISQVQVQGDWMLTWMSGRAETDISAPDHGVFTGYAYDDAERAFYFGLQGWLNREDPWRDRTDLPGVYFRASWANDSFAASGDLYRSLPIFMTTEPGMAIVSDSPMALLQLRRRLGLKVTVDGTVGDSLRWKNSMSAQLMSFRTLVREIEYVSVGSRLQMDLNSPDARLSTVDRDYRSLFSVPSEGYGEIMRGAAVNVASTIQTIASFGPGSTRFSLSGGKDSRICLAAALLSPTARENSLFTCTNTSPAHARDAEVVDSLASRFDFTLGLSGRPPEFGYRTWRLRDVLGTWYSDCALMYYPVRMQAFGLKDKGKFTITGIGSELYKGNYGLRPLSAIVESLRTRAPDAAPAVDAVCTEYLARHGLEPEDHLSAEWHYLGMRNAIHGGRATPITKFSIRPLYQQALVGLSKVDPAEQKEGMLGPAWITEDLLVLLGPELASHPFDLEKKNRTTEWVDERLQLLGGPISPDELEHYRVHGDAGDVPVGPVSALAVLSDVGHEHGPLTRETVEGQARAAAQVIAQSPWAEKWKSLLAEVSEQLEDRRIPVGHASGMVGRLLSLGEALR